MTLVYGVRFPGNVGVARSPHLRPERLRGVEAGGAGLTRQIPWLRVFVEGVVIVGSILLT